MGDDDERYSFTWGLSLLNDLGYVQLFRFMLTSYIELGMSRPEMLVLIHLASYHYNTEKGKSCPSHSTLAKEMGYSDRSTVFRLISSMERKGLLKIERRLGDTSIYNARPFAWRALKLWLNNIDEETLENEVTGGVAKKSQGGVAKKSHEEEELSTRTEEELAAPPIPETPTSQADPPRAQDPRLARLRQKFGADPLTLAAHCAATRHAAGIPEDVASRPRSWQTEDISDAEFQVCQRVADLWAGGKMAGLPRFVDPQVEAAGEVLRLFDGDMGKALETITSYFEHYEAEWQRTGSRPFSVVGPQSLVNVLRTFEAEAGYEAEAPPRAERFLF